ncbi:MAG TPA: hypothetical protein VKV26_06565 [Dehalococcoidia bacterium]|nr:hypothetical protein [Dehalococcoidia bacterium]
MRLSTVDAGRTHEPLPAALLFASKPSAPAELPAPAAPAPLRCRLGMHRWLPLALSLHGADAGLSVAFCRDCPRVRRPARLG